MRSNLLISCFVAVSIHAVVLSLPLNRISSSALSPVHRPILLSIVPPENPVAAAPAVQVQTDSPSETVSPSKKQPSLKETPHPEKDNVRQKTSVAMPVAEPDFSGEKGAGEDTKPSTGSVAVETALVPGDTTPGSQRGMAALGNHQGQDVIIYARPKYKENPLPQYPEAARRRGYEGRTLLRVQVLASGKVGQVKIMTSSGYEVLDKAALRSVKDWLFIPGTKNGKGIDQWVMVPFRFSLR